MSSSRRLSGRVTLPVAVLLAFTAEAASAQTPLKSTEFVAGSWSLVLLPDTQKYSLSHPETFTVQTQWIATNKNKYDIRYVLHLGDITDENTDAEWRNAQKALTELDGKVPYALGTGNHDFYVTSGTVTTWRTTKLNKYFPPSKFKDWPTFGGGMKPNDAANSYHVFGAGGIDWIIIVLQWGPRDPDVAWANRILATYPDRKAILVTHAYLFNDSTRYDHTTKQQAWNPHAIAEKYKCPNPPVNDGEQLWQKLVRKNNFVFTFNGHVLGSGLGFLASKNDRGKTVYQMLVNYQMRNGGGEGYLRILEFLPDRKTVHVKSYSPLLDKYLNDPANQFSIDLDL